MELVIPSIDENPRSRLDFDDLERILTVAPRKATYEPDSNGFYLKNEDIIIRYIGGQIFQGGQMFEQHHILLWFPGVAPIVSFACLDLAIKELFWGLKCDKIQLYELIAGFYPFLPKILRKLIRE